MSESIPNGPIDPDLVTSYYNRVCNVLDEIAAVKERCKEECVPLQEDVKSIKDEAKAAGIPLKTFNGMLKKRSLEARLEAIPSMMDEDEAAMFEFACAVLSNSEG